jgi:hypothetical protein
MAPVPSRRRPTRIRGAAGQERTTIGRVRQRQTLPRSFPIYTGLLLKRLLTESDNPALFQGVDFYRTDQFSRMMALIFTIYEIISPPARRPAQRQNRLLRLFFCLPAMGLRPASHLRGQGRDMPAGGKLSLRPDGAGLNPSGRARRRPRASPARGGPVSDAACRSSCRRGRSSRRPDWRRRRRRPGARGPRPPPTA